jgi:hypothetical protein
MAAAPGFREADLAILEILQAPSLVNRYYETFADNKAACNQFFADLEAYAAQLRSLLTENFEIIRDP